METILTQLTALADEKNAAFVAKLVPHIPPENILGCRTPQLRALAKELGTESSQVREFLTALPHRYFDEDQLHAFLISRIRNFEECAQAVDAFLPYVNNWATCDQLSPTVFRRKSALLLPYIDRWLTEAHPYAKRFAIGMLMQHFLGEQFDPSYPARIAALCCEEYYINMEIAWYFATAMAKQPEAVLPYLTERRLTAWVHRKTIQKCIESRRIPDETKAFLRTLR